MKRSPVQGILAAVILATVSLLTNLQSPEDLSVVDVQPLLVTRLVLSYLTNGAVRALLLIFAGWSWGRRWWQAALWAIVCGELALAVHYLLGWAIGFFDWSDVLSNLYWFVVALGDGLLLGVAGWVMRRTDGWGFAASLLVPGGLIAEPVMNLLPARDWLRPSDAVALRTAGWIELVIGVVLLLLVLLTWRFVARRSDERSQ